MPSRSSQFQKYCNLIVQSKRVCFQLLSAKLCTFSLNICLRKQTTPPDRTDQFVSILVHYIPFTISDVTFTICVAFVSWFSLHEIIWLQDKPWVYAHLLDIQRRIGADHFPLIPQTYHPDHTHMVSCDQRIAINVFVEEAI